MKKYIIILENKQAEIFDDILKAEHMTASEWLQNAAEDYDS